MSCDIVIAVWNLKRYTKNCVESIIANTDYPYRLILVDNGSFPETKEYLESLKLDPRLKGHDYTLIRNEENLGATKALNQGLSVSKGDYAMILNNDTIVCKGWLGEMVRIAEFSKEIGIVNPNSNNLGLRKPWWMSLERFAANLMKKYSGQHVEMATAVGFCYMVKREVINKIGILSEEYGLGNFEETEYSIRAAMSGYKSVFSKASYVWHKEHASFDLIKDFEEMFEKNQKMFYEMFGKPQRILYILTRKDDRYIQKLKKETYVMAQKCNWIWAISKLSLGKIPLNVHTNISRFRYIIPGFRSRCILKVLLKKKKFDRIITDDNILFNILTGLKRFHRGKVLSIEKYISMDDSEFLNINLGCLGRACYGYVNIDEKRTHKKILRSSFSDLPFEDKAVKRILLDYNAVSGKPQAELDAIFTELERVSIPGCVLSVDNFSDKLSRVIAKSDFKPLSDSYKKLFSVKSFMYKTPFIDNFKGGEVNIRVSDMDKGSLAQAVNENGYLIDSLEPKDSLVEITARKIIQPGPGSKRICAIGQFMLLRYNQLGFDWDALPRSFEKLGMDYLLLEGMRNQDAKKMRDAILSFKPDYLLVILKDNLNFIKDISLDLKTIGAKVIYWFCDPEHPKKEDLSNVIDVMFLTNRGQLDEYKAAYNLKRVYYMPQGYGPYVQRRLNLKEIYDIGFSGAISDEPLHKTRRELIEAMGARYQLKISNNIRNNIAEFYSQSKTVFGVSDFDYELYTSNRFFVALGCGACYVTKKFKGIELLAENKKHVLWFETKEELFSVLDYYIAHDAERDKIRQAGQTLALEKHTYDARLKNVLDIMEGRTDKFYGFLH